MRLADLSLSRAATDYDPDTDGDGIPDGEDLNVNRYDVTYTGWYELTADSTDYGMYPVDELFMNTNNFTYQMFERNSTVTDFVDDMNIGKWYGRPLYRYLQAYLSVLEDFEYTLDELIYMGHTDPELVK